MKEFFKMTGATLLALILFFTVAGFMSMSVLIAMASMGQGTTTLDKDAILRLELKGELVERSKDDTMEALMGQIYGEDGTLALDDIRYALERAKESGKIKAVYLDCGMLSAGGASIQELRNMLSDFKEETGVPMIAYADSYTQGSYWIATVADSVYMNPQGNLLVNGMFTKLMFFKNTLEKLGVEMQIFKVGTFKSAVEPYILDKMSDANRLQMQQIADGVWQIMTKEIAESRNIDAKVLDNYVNAGGFFQPAEFALSSNMLDGLKYRSDVESEIKARFGKDVKFASLGFMKNMASKEPYSANKVAVLYAIGDIDGGKESSMKSEKIAEELNKLADNDKVKAVVLRVNSPGGSAFGSEQMWYAAKRLKEKKPLIVSMGNYAASGGYYMSCIADTIVAQPSTLTGSIGIFGMFPNSKGLLDKIGLKFDEVKTHELSSFGDMTRPMTEAERMLMQQYINRGYELFVSRCAEGRNVTADEIKAIAEGRVWLGNKALTLNLVDVEGGLDTAIDIAARKAGLTNNYSVAEYPVKKDFITTLMEELQGDMYVRSVKNRLGDKARFVEEYIQMTNLTGVQALMPYRVEL